MSKSFSEADFLRVAFLVFGPFGSAELGFTTALPFAFALLVPSSRGSLLDVPPLAADDFDLVVGRRADAGVDDAPAVAMGVPDSELFAEAARGLEAASPR